ncbi:cell envelope integrity protein TolA [Candidatus Finniella inopinata]|uniref:Uncharacterized protein n=1 Tax=Candidatus Finniella inopinata TaxID=1696036 RepID=A0A4Q7DFE4_9PROT|nr:cell envelope integrity protein TolA [Candidatus Finniella inopinata]RZI45352.1 hypothetical protein EQU50_07430 [Candidatus Finniella inopinata]
MQWLRNTFTPWLNSKRQEGDSCAINYTGISLLDVQNFLKGYSSQVLQNNTAARVATQQAEAEKAQLLQQLETAKRRHSVEESARQEAERARAEHEKREREIAAEKQALELKHKAEQEAHRQAIEKQKKFEEDARAAEVRRKQEELKHKAEQEAHRQTQEKVKLSEQKFNALVKKAQEYGIDPSILDAVLPATDDLEEELKGVGQKSSSLPHLMKWYIELLKEIKKNENAAEQIKKDCGTASRAVFAGTAILLDDDTKVEVAIEAINTIYKSARQYKETLPESFEKFRELALRQIKPPSNSFDNYMTTTLLTPMFDALERLDGKDSLQMSLDANAKFEQLLTGLVDVGAYKPDLVNPISQKIIDSNKRIQDEIIKRNRTLYEQFNPLLISEAKKIEKLPSERKLNEIPLVVLLTCSEPAGFLLVNTNPSLDDLKEDLPTLTVDQLKALFAYLFGLADDFGGVLQIFSQRSHTPTKVKEPDIQQLLSIVKTRVHQAEKEGKYQPDPYKVSSSKKESISAFLKKTEDFVSGKTYRDTIQRRFGEVYLPLSDYIRSCRQTDLEEFKLEILSQRGAKGPIEETAAEQQIRRALIDQIIGFQKQFSILDLSRINNDELKVLTQQFSDLKAAVEANGERFKTNFTAFLKRRDPNYVAPTIVIRPSPSPSPISSLTSSRSNSPPTTPPAAPPAPSFDAPPPPPPPGPPPSASDLSSSSSSGTVVPATSSSSAPDRTKLLGALQGANIPTRLIEFSRTLSSTQKTKWTGLDKKAKILWMDSGNEP